MGSMPPPGEPPAEPEEPAEPPGQSGQATPSEERPFAHVLGLVRVLLLPADAERACAVLAVPPTAAGLSDALGGALLDDVVHGTVNGLVYCVYVDERRHDLGLPDNPRARVLATHLGWLRHAWDVGLRGDALVAGVDVRGNDTDVPLALLLTARLAGLLRGEWGW